MTSRQAYTSGAGWPERLGALLLVLGLWALAAWVVWELVWPGPAPCFTLLSPDTEQVLPLDAPLTLRGHLKGGRALTCNGREIRPGSGGGFEAPVPGPTAPGMYLVRCSAENARGRSFPYVYGRLAGDTLPLGDPIPDAVVLAVPFASLAGKGGLLAPLATFVTERLGPPLIDAAARFVTTWEGATIGPIRLGAVTLLRVEAGSAEAIVVTLGLQRVEVDLEVPEGWVPSALPSALRRFWPALGGKQTLRLGKELPVSVTLAWPPGERPRLSVGLLSSELLRTAFRFRFVADALVGALGALSRKWQADLDRALNGAAEVIAALDRLHQGLETQLGRVGALLPPLPALVSPQQPAVCFSLSLGRLRSDRESGLATLHLSARIQGVIRGGKRCADARPGEVRPVPLGGHLTRRLVLGPPLPPKGLTRPALLVAHDLVNAYLAAVWASGALDRVPIRLPALAEQGFDIRSLAYHLPPVVSTSPDGRLRLEVPELGVDLGTLGEPRRLFSAHLRLPLGVSSPQPGRVRLGVDRQAPPVIHLRCEREAQGRPGKPGGGCPAQSKRFQSLVNVATELALRPELATPPLALEAALPALRAAGVSIRVGRVVPLARGLQVELEVQQAR